MKLYKKKKGEKTIMPLLLMWPYLVDNAVILGGAQRRGRAESSLFASI